MEIKHFHVLCSLYLRTNTRPTKLGAPTSLYKLCYYVHESTSLLFFSRYGCCFTMADLPNNISYINRIYLAVKKIIYYFLCTSLVQMFPLKTCVFKLLSCVGYHQREQIWIMWKLWEQDKEKTAGMYLFLFLLNLSKFSHTFLVFFFKKH